MEIEKIQKIQIPKINTLINTPHITRQLNVQKPGIDFLIPSYTPIEYNPKKMQYVQKAQPPNPSDPPNPPDADLPGDDVLPEEKEIDCPAKDQAYRLGDLRNAKAKEKVIGFEVVNKKCVEIWGPTSIADRFLPSPSVAATTFGITIVATSAATLTPILTKALKPLFKQLVGKVKKLLGKKEKKLTRSEIKTNLYRQKRDLPPLKK